MWGLFRLKGGESMDINVLEETKDKIAMLGIMFAEIANQKFTPPDTLNEGFYDGLEVICMEIGRTVGEVIDELKSKRKPAVAET
jgi:hypothetical protein